ncbi:Translocon-associated protein subunit alpha [Heracleum sosnowskyi]|uniref:Translocon-associated protein subunit alpha n=1 Tax=Heracleum sosnowskyi TaxID=360622 RepID=A0AAD8HLL9_9APIA|nr:Translocon-associated protein subunit alpha [Heracleum sosnowskyi]
MSWIRVLLLLALLFFSAPPFLRVARCQSESDTEVEATQDGGQLGIVDHDVQDLGAGSFISAPGVETLCLFPKNPSKSVVAGEPTDLLIGLKYEGGSSLNVIAVQASVHLPYDHNLLVQNLSSQAFNNASVPTSVQATFPYTFAVSKFLQAGTFDFVGIIVYEIDSTAYQSTFYNGTIEVTEAGGSLSVESVFLFSLGVALLVLLGLWIRTQISQFSKKTKRVQKVEVGTETTDASMDEWLEGTAYSQSNKSKKKK